LLLEPAPAILLAAALVHAVRRNVFDLVVFLGVVAVIVFDSARHRPSTAAVRVPNPAGPRWAATATLLVVGAAMGAMPLASWPLRISLAALGLIALGLVATAAPPGPPVEPTGAAERGGALWAGTFLVAAVLELANFLWQPDPQTDSYPHPTLSALIGPELTARPVRMVVLAFWLVGLGWIVNACRTQAPDVPNPATGDGVGR
jgi:hypothetical protein